MTDKVKTKQTNVVPQETNTQVAIPSGAWGVADNVIAEDVVLSKLHLMQGLSKAVQKRKAEIGDIIDSETNEKLGDATSPVEIIIFKMQKFWEYSKKVMKSGQTKEEFVRREVAETFGALPFELFENGETLYRRRNYVFLCAVIGKDGKPKNFPYILRMKKTTIPIAKALAKYFTDLSKQGKPSAFNVINLSAEEVEKEGNIYNIWSYEIGRQSSKEELMVAWNMYKQFEDAKEKYSAVVAAADAEDESVADISEAEEVF